MEGWNDCPPSTLSRDPSNSSISSSRSKRRTPRLSGLAVGVNTPSPRRTPSTLVDAPPIGRTLLVSSFLLASTLETLLLNTTNPEALAADFGDVNETPEKFHNIFKSANLSAKDETFFTKRLVDVYPTLGDNHKEFITRIVDGITNKETSASLKGEILNYMMVNSGVSTWCVPLKKLVDTL